MIDGDTASQENRNKLHRLAEHEQRLTSVPKYLMIERWSHTVKKRIRNRRETLLSLSDVISEWYKDVVMLGSCPERLSGEASS